MGSWWPGMQVVESMWLYNFEAIPGGKLCLEEPIQKSGWIPPNYDVPNAHLLFMLGRNTMASTSGWLSFFGNLSNFWDKLSLLFDYLPLLTQPLIQANSTLYRTTYFPACKSLSIHLDSRSNHLNINNVSLPISYILYLVTMAAHPFQY